MTDFVQMILENSSKIDAPNSLNIPSHVNFNGNSNYPYEKSELSRIKSEFHKQIRIQELNKIKAEKRRNLQINLTI